jgi:F0F1-type ATP synthase membrane subunit a
MSSKHGLGGCMEKNSQLKGNIHQILLVVAAFLVMVLVSYNYVYQQVRDQMKTIGDVSMELVRQSISSSFGETEILFANVVLSVESMLSWTRRMKKF